VAAAPPSGDNGLSVGFPINRCSLRVKGRRPVLPFLRSLRTTEEEKSDGPDDLLSQPREAGALFFLRARRTSGCLSGSRCPPRVGLPLLAQWGSGFGTRLQFHVA